MGSVGSVQRSRGGDSGLRDRGQRATPQLLHPRFRGREGGSGSRAGFRASWTRGGGSAERNPGSWGWLGAGQSGGRKSLRERKLRSGRGGDERAGVGHGDGGFPILHVSVLAARRAQGWSCRGGSGRPVTAVTVAHIAFRVWRVAYLRLGNPLGKE